MGRNRFFQALKIITALEYRNNSASRGAIGEVHQFSRNPPEVFGFEIERSQGITMMRIESGRDDDELGAEFAQVGQDRVFESGAKFRAAIFRRERRVDDVVVVAAFTAGAGAWEQRHLMRRAIHHGLVAPENILGAIAMVDVEIDHGCAADAVFTLGMARGNSSVIRKTNCPSWMFFDEKLTELAATMTISTIIAHAAPLARCSISANRAIKPTVSRMVWMMPNCTTHEIQKSSMP